MVRDHIGDGMQRIHLIYPGTAYFLYVIKVHEFPLMPASHKYAACVQCHSRPTGVPNRQLYFCALPLLSFSSAFRSSHIASGWV